MTNIANDFTYVAKELVINNKVHHDKLTELSAELTDPIIVLGRFKPVINAIKDNSNAVGDRVEKAIMPAIEEQLEEIRKELERLHTKIDNLDAGHTLDAVLAKLASIEIQFKERNLGDTQPMKPVNQPTDPPKLGPG
jgi:gas vesicle protein